MWRYLDLAKLVSILSQKALFFARLDSQLDRFEGSLPAQSLSDISPEDVAHDPVIRGLSEHADIMRVSLAQFRPRALISCWHVSEHESAAMWDLYSQSGQGIAIRSSVDRLRQSLDAVTRTIPQIEQLPGALIDTNYFMGLVRYVDFDNDVLVPATGLDYLTIKKQSYEHEREVRIVLLSDLPVSGGQQVSCSLEVLVDSIYVSPMAPTWFRETVAAVIRQFGFEWVPVQSDLAGTPLL